MIILDTNVVSEPTRPHPSEDVRSWLATQPRAETYITAITAAELLYGLALMTNGRRKQALARALRDLIGIEFRDRILPFDQRAAEHFAMIASDRRKTGTPINVYDAQIAAIARAHRAKIATRDIGDFRDCGVELIDPWAG